MLLMVALSVMVFLSGLADGKVPHWVSGVKFFRLIAINSYGIS